MAILLVQHGLSFSKEVDPERGLSETGRKITNDMAALANQKKLRVKRVFHSGKKRALQTALIFASAIDPSGKIEQIEGINPSDDVKKFADSFDFDDDVMLVGHLPFLEKLVSYLITGSDEYLPVRFQNSGIVCLEKDEDTGRFYIKWTLMPEVK